jgi:hypothetical protein
MKNLWSSSILSAWFEQQLFFTTHSDETFLICHSVLQNLNVWKEVTSGVRMVVYLHKRHQRGATNLPCCKSAPAPPGSRRRTSPLFLESPPPALHEVGMFQKFEMLLIANSSVYWVTMPWSPVKVKRRFGGICHLHLQGQRISQTRNQHEGDSKESSKSVCCLFHSSFIYQFTFQALKMKVTSSSKTLHGFHQNSWHHKTGDRILHNHLYDKFKSYIFLITFIKLYTF